MPPPKHPILSVRNFTGLFYARPGRADRPYYNDPVPTPLSLTPALRQALDRMAADLRRVFADRFIALVATTAHSGVAFVTAIQAGDLDALGPLSSTWERDALDPPLLLTPDELRRSLDAFPVEYRALLEKHEIIAGTPPFESLAVAPEHLRRACEVQAKSHLIHLRQGWMQCGGDKAALAALLVRSAAPLRAVLGYVAELTDAGPAGDPLAGARAASLDSDLVERILALEDDEEAARGLVDALPAYLKQAERLWVFVDAWTPQ